jgi:hypothetical protein
MGLRNLLHTRATYADCQIKYPDAENPIPALPSFQTIGVSLAILILTIALEKCVRPSQETTWEPRSGITRETSEVSSVYPDEDGFRRESVDVEASFAGTGNVATIKTVDGEHSQPTLKDRAHNLMVATLFIIPICIVFALRIRDAKRPVGPADYDAFCRKEMHVSRTQWWAVVLFNIVPLICACMAWLRTLVDCILVRWNRSLTYEMWPPVWPISMVARVVLPIARNMVLLFAMRPSKAAARRKSTDVETGPRADMHEERRGLMPEENVTDDDEATAYDPRISDEQLK